MSELENMINDNLIYLLKFLSMKDKMSLRASSTTLRRRIDELENTFKIWRNIPVDSTGLRRLADEIRTIQELDIWLITSDNTPGCGPVLKYLFKKHEELETISIYLDRERCAEDEKDIVLTIFSNLNLRYITIYEMEITEDIVGCLPSTLPNLEKLALNWTSLSYQGLIEILNRSENIRELDLSHSKITGVGVEEGVNSLPNLEVLNLTWCDNLPDGGLKDFIMLSGNKLRVLDVSGTIITGQGFKEGVSLPMLEELNLGGCESEQLTDSDLLEILSISGRRLKTVNLSLSAHHYIYTETSSGVRSSGIQCNLSAGVRSTLRTLYPSVQFKYNW